MPTDAPRLVLVHAHPDDETLWTGGTAARYAAAGTRVTLVTCTLGEQGEIVPPELRGLAADRADQLGGYRMGELAAACAALGIADRRRLGGAGRWRDSGMVVAPGGRATAAPELHPRAFAGPDPAQQAAQVEALVAVLEEVRPQVVVTYGPDGGYGHPDHIRAHQVTMAAAGRVPGVARVFWAVAPRSAVLAGIDGLRAMPGLPFALPDELPSVPDAATCAVDVRAQLPAVLAALRAHATQVSVWSDGPGRRAVALSNGVALPIPDVEHYTLARGPAAGAHEDLFGGLPMAAG